MTADISRRFSDRNKLFAALQRQQGRIPTDAEEDSGDDMLRSAHEVSFAEAISPLGSPDDGFKIALRPGDNTGFDILAGSFYLAGNRIENPVKLDFKDQAKGNWLTMAAADLPIAGSKIAVCLEVHEHTISATEDAENFDPALRGADGAARKRVSWRVRQGPTTAATCDAALADLFDTATLAARDPLTGELKPTGTLTVGFDGDGADLDLCKPATQAGYLGNRNNCYRVKHNAAGRFLWSEDNGSQLYRVAISADRKSLKFITQPRDEYLRPKSGYVIELLRPDLLMPNLEKAAEEDGYLVKASANFADGSLALSTTLAIETQLAAFDAWLNGLDPALFDDPAKRWFYARVWTGGGEGAALDHGFTAGTPVQLAGTGLTITFNGAVLPGSSWTIAARPDAPELVLPWALLHGLEAQAPRRFIAPLAIVDLTTATVHHCRPHFRPLWRIEGCCSVTVGDGETSLGDYQHIGDAVAALPAEGGTVCLLPGTHRANVSLSGRTNIRFSGCKGRSRWIADNPANPLATLTDCTSISFVDIEMEATGSCCILATKSNPLDASIANGGLLVCGCKLLARAGWAISARDQEGCVIEHSEVIAGPLAARNAADPTQTFSALFLGGHRLRVERCRIAAPLSVGQAESLRAMGGIHIAGGSSEVEIRRNLIEEGAGMGIMLGSIHIETVIIEGPPHWTEGPVGVRYIIDDAGCITIVWYPPPGTGDGGEEIHSDGEVTKIRIIDNEIRAMGSNGIGSFPVLLVAEDGTPAEDAILVSFLSVIANHIHGCARYEPAPLGPVGRMFTGRGGIAIALLIDSLFDDNRIEENGGISGYESCGISIIYGETTRIFDNVIAANDVWRERVKALGPNSGIDIKLAVGGLPAAGDPQVSGVSLASGAGANFTNATGANFAATGRRTPDSQAVVIHGNQVDQPAGRAVRLLAIGPVSMQDNFLTGAQPSRLFSDLAGAIKIIGLAVNNMAKHVQQQQLVIIETLLDLAGGDAVQIFNLGLAQDIFTLIWSRGIRDKQSSAATGEANGASGSNSLSGFIVQMANAQVFAALPAIFQRGGETMLVDNQISLRRPFVGGPQGSMSAILVVTLDDLEFSDNQFEADIERGWVLIDAILYGVTTRAVGNRGQEGALCWRSIQAYGLAANNVAHNQLTCPLAATGANVVAVHNQIAI